MDNGFFVWDDDLYSVGDDVIDQQHRRLLSILNRLYVLIQEERDMPTTTGTAAVMHELTHYIVDHFSYEEQRLQDTHYPLACLQQHRAEHDGFVAQVLAFEKRLYAGDPKVLDGMLSYLCGDWLTKHICGTDMGYRAYLHPGASAGSAGPGD